MLSGQTIETRPAGYADPISGGPGLYVHWPFCESKCPYCDFNSHIAGALDAEIWKQALLAELDWMLAKAGPLISRQQPFATVFFGGGTPSLMPPAIIAALLERLDRQGLLASDAEITAEANPGSADRAQLAAMQAAGINRLSLGLQALQPEGLVQLGRKHSVADGWAALEVAQKLFSAVSADLIYGWRGQSLAGWQADLAQICQLGLTHLSAYQLTIEPGTVFATRTKQGEMLAAEDDLMADFYELTGACLAAAGLPAYEISNHARPTAECRHNLNYWRCGDWLGIGPGAVGRIGQAGQRLEMKTRRSPQGWLDAVARQGHGLDTETVQQTEQDVTERLMMGLRLAEGVLLTGPEAAQLDQQQLASFIAEGWLSEATGRLTASQAGWLRLDHLLARLLP